MTRMFDNTRTENNPTVKQLLKRIISFEGPTNYISLEQKGYAIKQVASQSKPERSNQKLLKY